MDINTGVDIVTGVVEMVGPRVREEFLDRLLATIPGLSERALSAAGVTTEIVEPVVAATSVASEVTPSTVETRDPTLEEQQRGSIFIEALVQKYGGSPEDFSVIATGVGDEVDITVAYNAGLGFYMGSWDTVFNRKDPASFMVEVEDQIFDTRSGMTEQIYRALVSRAQTDGHPLPDSLEVAQAAGRKMSGGGSTWTMLTGQKLTPEGRAPFATTNKDGSIDVKDFGHDRGDDHRGLFFRPTITLPRNK